MTTTRISATDRELFDLFNELLGEPYTRRICAAQARLVTRGNRADDARAMAEASHIKWLSDGSIKGAN